MRFLTFKCMLLVTASAVLLLGVCTEAQATMTFAWDFEGAPVNGPAANIGDGGTQDITYNNGAVTTNSTAAFGNDSLSLSAHPLTRGKMDPFFGSAQTQMSISVWVNAAAVDNNDAMVDRTPDGAATDDSTFRFSFFGGDLRPQLFLRNGGGGLSQNLASLAGTAGVWNHYVVSYDGTQADPADRVRIWVNKVEDPVGNYGVTVPTSIGAIPGTDGQWRVGIRIDGSGVMNASFFDDLLITDQTLGQADVDTLFSQGLATYLIPEPASIALLSLGMAMVLLRRRSE